MNAFRRDDRPAIESLISQIDTSQPLPHLESPLHIAVMCADPQTIDFVLRHLHMDPNTQASDTGNTPLHLAVSTDRLEAAALLLSQPSINDTIENKDMKTPMQLVTSTDMMHLLQNSRAELRSRIVYELEDYEAKASQNVMGSEEEMALLATVCLPRVTAVDLAVVSHTSNNDVLHSAVKYKSTDLIKACVNKGVDPYVKDINGRSADNMTEDKMIHALLRQLAHAGAENSISLQQSPKYRGFMGKWTNYVHGFKTRWFVLEDGVLSYYRSPEEEGRQARGVIHMRHAVIVPDRKERNRFEIVSKSSKDTMRWYLRSSDAAECVRWIQILEKARQFLQSDSSSAPDKSVAATMNQTSPMINSQSHRLSGSFAEAPEPVTSLSDNMQELTFDDAASDVGSVDGSVSGSTVLPHVKNFAMVNNMMTLHFEVSMQLLDELERSENATSTGLAAPVQASNVVVPTASTGIPQPVATVSSTSARSQSEIRAALRRSMEERAQLWQEFSTMTQERETYMRKEIERLERTRQLWEEQVMLIDKQHNELMEELRGTASENAQLRKERRLFQQNGAAISTPSNEDGPVQDQSNGLPHAVSATAGAVTAAAGAAAGAAGAAAGMISHILPSRQNTYSSDTYDDDDDEFYDFGETDDTSNLYVEPALQSYHDDDQEVAPNVPDKDNAPQKPDEGAGADADVVSERSGATGATATGAGAGAATAGAAGAAGAASTSDDKASASDKKEEDSATPSSSEDDEMFTGPGFDPYNHLRHKMPIGKDNRPSMSLWGILKNNIGKDLTKISFPVAFNEPTSMLQRMSEDLEFSECLDAASKQKDSLRRIMFVAAFAMSNYSSTIGRIAKPFNPMLGETFEYVRPDRHYRYVSEQVSHHPPISACFCESPTWEYMGCVDAKSKFMGRTFEIKPTGVAHVKLKVDPEWIPGGQGTSLAHAPGDDKHVLEHYSWNKVTTCISGFITGSTTIDHYGDMVVTNHATGETCTLTFMPRGWRSANAFEIRGKAVDANGKTQWEIAGRWNSQLIARPATSGSKDLNPDSQVSQDDKNLLLWRNSKKYPTPFNLTPFAITLNSRPDGLKDYLPPTDCRLRPDLSAFEVGQFDKADQLKVQLEQLQRETRVKREQGQLPPHKPHWFAKTTDKDTNASFWKPLTSKDEHGRETMNYWIERAEVGKKRANQEQAEWKGCDHIFGNIAQ